MWAYLKPIHNHQHTVSRREAHAEVRASPEEKGKSSTAGRNVSVPPGNIGNSTLHTNVCKRPLMRVRKRRKLLDLPDLLRFLRHLLLQRLLILGCLLGGFLNEDVEVLELLLERLGARHVVEEAGQEGTLLPSDLGGGRVLCDGAVTERPDAVGALDDHVLIDDEAAAGALLGRDARDEVSDDRADCVTGGPDETAVREDLELFAAVGIGDFGFDVFVGDALDHGFGAQVDFLFVERLFGVLDEGLGEHGEDVGEGFHEGHVELVRDVGDPFAEVVFEEVLQLSGEFDTGRTTTDDNLVGGVSRLGDFTRGCASWRETHHVKKTLLLLLGLILEQRSLDAVHNLGPNLLRVGNLLQEARMLFHTRDSYNTRSAHVTWGVPCV